MATHGLFTFDDLYAGRAKEYHYRNIVSRLWLPAKQLGSNTTTFDSLRPENKDLLELISSTNVESSTSTNELVPLESMSYLKWLLISFAIVFILLLNIIAIYYCYRYFKKTSQVRREKQQQTIPSFYRYRASKRGTPLYNIYQSATPLFFSSPINASRSTSTQSLNNQLLRQGLDAVGTPQSSRVKESIKEPSSTFTSAASDLLMEIKGRLSTRSSKLSLHTNETSDDQKANMTFNDESKINS